MRFFLAILATAALCCGHEHQLTGDDIRGYSDTPVIPGQKWKVHDLERPRPQKVTPRSICRRRPAGRCARAVRWQGPFPMGGPGARR